MADASGNWPESAIPKPIVPATSSTPGSASGAPPCQRERRPAQARRVDRPGGLKNQRRQKYEQQRIAEMEGQGDRMDRRRAGPKGNQRHGAWNLQALGQQRDQHCNSEEADQ